MPSLTRGGGHSRQVQAVHRLKSNAQHCGWMLVKPQPQPSNHAPLHQFSRPCSPGSPCSLGSPGCLEAKTARGPQPAPFLLDIRGHPSGTPSQSAHDWQRTSTIQRGDITSLDNVCQEMAKRQAVPSGAISFRERSLFRCDIDGA